MPGTEAAVPAAGSLQDSHPFTFTITTVCMLVEEYRWMLLLSLKSYILSLGILWGRKYTLADPALLIHNNKEIKNLGTKICNIILFTAHTQNTFKSEYMPTAKYWGEKGGLIIPVPPGSLRLCVFLWWLACGFVVHYSFPEPYILLKHKYRPTNLLTSWSIGSRTLRGIMLLPPWCSPLFRKRREKEREWKKNPQSFSTSHFTCWDNEV